MYSNMVVIQNKKKYCKDNPNIYVLIIHCIFFCVSKINLNYFEITKEDKLNFNP